MTDDPADSSAVQLADDISALLYGIAGWLSIGFGSLAIAAMGVQLATGGITSGTAALLATLWMVVGFVLVALGAFVNPRLRRRLNRRHAPTEFGRVRSVDRRVIRADENCSERCVDCQSPIDEGLVRRYREEYAIAGIPVYTLSEGYNHYCLECASRDVLGPRSDAAESTRERPHRRRSQQRQSWDGSETQATTEEARYDRN